MVVDLNLLRTFAAVVKYNHFGKAAEAINATQPGVSQHIARLESQLGVKLLQRTKRSVALTPAGAAVYERSRQLLSLARRMEDEARHIENGGAGILIVGMTSWVIHTSVPQRIAAFRLAHPDVEMRFVVQGGDVLRKMMDDDELDLMISPLPMRSAEYESVVLTHQQMGVALPVDHPLKGRDSVNLMEIAQEHFIVVPREHDPEGHDGFIARMNELNMSVSISSYETPSLNALARVAVGEGIALVPMSYRTDVLAPVQIVRLLDPKLDQSAIYGAIRSTGRQTLAERLLDGLR